MAPVESGPGVQAPGGATGATGATGAGCRPQPQTARSALSVAEVLRDGLACADPGRLALSVHQRRVFAALLACRSEAAGGHRWRCMDCGREHFAPHSCGNRHCPQCQGRRAALWLESQSACVLPVAYFHVVFALPHELNALIRQNPAACLKLLFSSAAGTLLTFAKERFNAAPGITAVLHTWGQTLCEHYHLHCIVTAGGLRTEGTDGAQWVRGSQRYLFAVRALSEVFRARMRDGLLELFETGALEFHGAQQAYADPATFRRWLGPVAARKWVVYAKPPFAGPQQVLGYLSRYTHRVAIGPRRLLSLDRERHVVRFAYRDYAGGGRRREMELTSAEFTRRFALHVLPRGMQKIRHYGLLSNRGRREKVALARALLEPERTPADRKRAAGAEAKTGGPQAACGCGAAPAPRCSEPSGISAAAALLNGGLALLAWLLVLWRTAPAQTPAGAEDPWLPRCPYCGSQRLELLERLPRLSARAALRRLDSS